MNRTRAAYDSALLIGALCCAARATIRNGALTVRRTGHRPAISIKLSLLRSEIADERYLQSYLIDGPAVGIAGGAILGVDPRERQDDVHLA